MPSVQTLGYSCSRVYSAAVPPDTDRTCLIRHFSLESNLGSRAKTKLVHPSAEVTQRHDGVVR